MDSSQDDEKSSVRQYAGGLPISVSLWCGLVLSMMMMIRSDLVLFFQLYLSRYSCYSFDLD